MKLNLENIFKKTEVMGIGCWRWCGSLNSYGYAKAIENGKQVLLHRRVYALTYGDILTGYQIDHLCRNRACVNPGHLEVVTLQENVKRGENHIAANAKKTECPMGHRYDRENTYTDKRGSRHCKECSRVRHKNRMRALAK